MVFRFRKCLAIEYGMRYGREARTHATTTRAALDNMEFEELSTNMMMRSAFFQYIIWGPAHTFVEDYEGIRFRQHDVSFIYFTIIVCGSYSYLRLSRSIRQGLS